MATINDLVLVHIDHKPGFYARIDDIAPDVKPGWWQVKLLVLSFPLQVFTWILDADQIDGSPFTMASTPIRLEKVVAPVARQIEEERHAAGDETPKSKQSTAKVVSLLERQKEK